MSILSRNFLGDDRENFLAPSCGDLDCSPGRPVTFCTMEDYCEDDEIFNNGNQDPKSQLFANLKDEYVPLGTERYVQSLVELKDQKVNRPITVNKKYTIQDRLYQVQTGNHTKLCVSAPSQDFSKCVSELQTKDGHFSGTISNNYKKLDDGSLEMVNKVLLKKQKQVLGHLIKQFGSVILSGKSIISISLPISIFEPKSLLERLADSFAFAPYFLEKGGQTKDTLEQFRLALAFYLTTITADLNPEKPFNPILGETFQAVIGGCPVYLEQISHHPPVAAFQMLGKNFTIEGTFEFQAAISANSVKCRKVGKFSVKFKNTGSVVQVQFPIGLMSGTAFGKRTYQCSKKLQVYSFTDNYYAEIDFDKTESANKKRGIAGFFSSSIYRMNDKFAVKMKQELLKQKDADIKFKEKDNAVEKLDKIEGSWLEGLTINDKPYWSFGSPLPHKLQYVDNPLPSDCNFRTDLLHLRNGDEIKAQDHKVLLEEAQRKDRKLREQSKHKHYK